MKILSSASCLIVSSTSSFFPPSSPSYPPPQCRRRRSSSSIHSFPFTGRTARLLHSRKGSSTAKNEVQHQSAGEEIGQNTEEPPPEDIKVLTAVRSIYNDIMILETPESRLLLLDSSHNVHSIFSKGGRSKWTDSYWDEFASLPPILPDGPIAIFGLGGGTATDLMLELWPSLQIEGWEIDEILIQKSREYLGLSELEKRAEAGGGGLRVRIGDALSVDSSVAGGYAGIIVDLFADGKVLRELEEVKTWVEIGEKLMPNGRIMVNCGGASSDGEELSLELGWERNNVIRAMRKAFPGAGELSWKLMPKEKGENFLALTGALPDLAAWSSALPDELSSNVYQWRICVAS